MPPRAQLHGDDRAGYGRALAGAPVEVMRDSDMQRYLDACARV
jgi:hypothetical protein